jgi:hypothetical protein
MNPLRQSACGKENGAELAHLSDPPALTEISPHSPGLRIVDEESVELLHGLNNVFVSLLLNAQVMEWKLPSYSRLKRNLHEVERNAQRGGELVKRLLKRMEAGPRGELPAEDSGVRTCGLGTVECAVARREPGPTTRTAELPIEPSGCSAPALESSSKKVPHTPV